MSTDDPTPPVADDEFPEFAAPPKHKPAPGSSARAKPKDESVDNAQAEVDAVIERIRKRKAQEQ